MNDPPAGLHGVSSHGSPKGEPGPGKNPSSARDERVVLLDKLSLFSLALVSLFFRNARVFYVHRSSLLDKVADAVNSFTGSRRKRFQKLDYVDFLGSFYETMEESCQRVNDDVWDRYKGNLYTRIASAFCPDPVLHAAIQKELLNKYVVERVKTRILLSHLARTHPGITFLPVDNEPIAEAISPGLRVPGGSMVPVWFRRCNAFLGRSLDVIYFLGFPFILSGAALIILRRGITLSRPVTRHFDLGYDVLGFGLRGDRGYDTGTGNYFLYNDSDFHPTKILHMVRPGQKLEPQARELYNRLGAPCIELDTLKIPAHFLVQKILREFLLDTLAHFLRYGRSSNIRSIFLIPSLASMKMIVDAGIHYEHYRPRVFISRDDYSSFHIARTIVAHEHGCRTVGFQWADYSNINSSFSHFVYDGYGLWGDFYRDFHAKGLKYSNTGITGANMYSSDAMYNLSQKHYLNEPYEQLKKQYTIVAIMGSAFEPERLHHERACDTVPQGGPRCNGEV